MLTCPSWFGASLNYCPVFGVHYIDRGFILLAERLVRGLLFLGADAEPDAHYVDITNDLDYQETSFGFLEKANGR
jgi:hypothetical protein